MVRTASTLEPMLFHHHKTQSQELRMAISPAKRMLEVELLVKRRESPHSELAVFHKVGMT